MVNTHLGLYQCTRLPFGVASAPTIFQKVMDTILQGIPGVICYPDDILVTGSKEAEHLHRLAEVLERLERHGVHVKRAKYAFLQDSVEYLGHRVDKEGLHTLQSKLDAVVLAPSPSNVQELILFRARELLWDIYSKFGHIIAPTQLLAAAWSHLELVQRLRGSLQKGESGTHILTGVRTL